ncbi:DsbA family protein [Burkholderia anthina]|uniref:DsbA family protein n=1 Tax=Burkholderia anthina TaxID=179879 RepID=UPI00158CEF67
MDKTIKLHYVYDPFCGWCYGLAPLLTVAAETDGVEIIPHSGGMLAGDRAQTMSADWRGFVRPHEARITALSGQKFGDAYTEKAQFDYDILLDSGPPTAAMIAAEAVGKAGLAMLKRLQIAYYVEGRPIANRDEIVRAAAEIGLDPSRFEQAFEHASENLDAHFSESQALLEKLRGQGYPTLAVERDGVLRKLHLGHVFGKPDLFREMLRDEVVPEKVA